MRTVWWICLAVQPPSAAMQEDFEEADKTGVVDLDAGIADGADGDREGKALEQREVDMNIERRRPLAHPAGRQSRVFLFEIART